MANQLRGESSPYLLQHADNPVDWYPWGEAAFRKAREEDKPVFLSIGYSTCHWCHVMAHESFEDGEIAALLNRHFVCVKVDKEERPDIDSIYMTVCQAFTGSGGWPTSIFMTPEQKPFFAGTYFPKTGRQGMIGLKELLSVIAEKWDTDRTVLLERAEQIVNRLGPDETAAKAFPEELFITAIEYYKHNYDQTNGGFGRAPKFPTPHNLLFLLAWYERKGNGTCLAMVEHTLTQMYRGGLFDHIGFGFSRYSTDQKFLVPHFEKMLYDNALLIMAYCKAYDLTQKPLYLEVAEKTADYILREMISPEGGFYSAQDADSEGEEGKYYLFSPREITELLGQEEGEAFCRQYDISDKGNFEGKNIPNLLGSDHADRSFERFFEQIREYRKNRYSLHLDDKILTAWNALMIAAMCRLYRSSGNARYLTAAKRADAFVQQYLYENGTLFVSFREGRRGVRGFLDDYAAYIFAQLALYDVTLEHRYPQQARTLCEYVLSSFWDSENGGFYLYSKEHEELILRPKETYDGAVPSGNSLMAWNLVRLAQLEEENRYERETERQLSFLISQAQQYPTGYAMFLLALLDREDPPPKLTVVWAQQENTEDLLRIIPPDAAVTVLTAPTKEYPLKNGKTTYYLCKGRRCLPPVNDLAEALQ